MTRYFKHLEWPWSPGSPENAYVRAIYKTYNVNTSYKLLRIYITLGVYIFI